MKIPSITRLKYPQMIKMAQSLSTQGITQNTANHLFYLNIDDAYIHGLYPLLSDDHIIKPNYFGKKLVGAHISIIYPEENKKIAKEDLQKTHNFLINDLVAAEIGKKIYYVLLIKSITLVALRKKYNLPPLLSFKGYSIGLHITIGIKNLNQLIN